MQKAASASKPIPVSNINVEIAEEVAKSFFALASRQKTRNLSILSRDSIMDWKNRTSIYVFNLQPNGYILTSADIKNEAIIGFSENGSFSAKPEYMSPALIATLAEIIIDTMRVCSTAMPAELETCWFCPIARISCPSFVFLNHTIKKHKAMIIRYESTGIRRPAILNEKAVSKT